MTALDEKSLDRYEGFPDFYYKQDFRLAVQTDSGEKELDAFAYIMHKNRPIGLPDRWYVHTCLTGYRDFGFDPNYLERAIQESRGESDET